jgi:hypothetical protein
MFREEDLEIGMDTFFHTAIVPIVRIFQNNLTTSKERVGGGGSDRTSIVALKKIADAFHPKEEWRPPVFALWRRGNAVSDALGGWECLSRGDWEQDRQRDKSREAFIHCTGESHLGVGVGGGSVRLVDHIRSDCFNDIKTTGFYTVNGSNGDKEPVERVGGHGHLNLSGDIGVEDSELVFRGDIDKSHLGVVEDSIIVDRLDPIVRDIHKNLLDVAVRCGVGNIVQFREKGMAPSSGKLESVGGEERHLE